MNDNAIPPQTTDRRFDRLLRLFGAEAMARLAKAHVMVIGCGGVGSWAAEGVARSAAGRLTMVDFDVVCIRNFNRQLQAIGGTVGKQKVMVLQERLRLINPAARIDAMPVFFTDKTCDEIMKDRPDFVIDAIDHVTAKCFLINYCRENKIPMIVSTGSGGRMDPTQIRIVDLGRTEKDPLARAIRHILRDQYGFPKKGDFGVQAVCTIEDPVEPHDAAGVSDCKSGCVCPQGENEFFSCTKRSVVLGTAGFVTGAFGMACASAAIRHIASGK
jgi:tRNA A37 threonylcarbamoyladenosine dehydratase